MDASAVIEERLQTWIEAVNARDIDAYADLVAEDLVWLPPVGAAVVGRAAFRRWLEPFFREWVYDYSASTTGHLAAGEDWIAQTGVFESRLTPAGGGETMTHGGRFLAIWRREADGVWRMDRYVDAARL